MIRCQTLLATTLPRGPPRWMVTGHHCSSHKFRVAVSTASGGFARTPLEARAGLADSFREAVLTPAERQNQACDRDTDMQRSAAEHQTRRPSTPLATAERIQFP